MRAQWEIEWKDYYKILGVSADSTETEIKTNFRKKAKEYHPDINPNINPELLQDLNEAYEILHDVNKRRNYDIEYKNRLNNANKSYSSYKEKYNLYYENKYEEIKSKLSVYRILYKSILEERDFRTKKSYKEYIRISKILFIPLIDEIGILLDNPEYFAKGIELLKEFEEINNLTFTEYKEYKTIRRAKRKEESHNKTHKFFRK